MLPTAQALKAKGLRVTPQRMAVFEALRSRKDHPSVEMVHEQVRKALPTISLNTVYTTLSALEEAGLIRRIDAGDGLGRYDGNAMAHLHIVCTGCLRVDDVALPVEASAAEMTRQVEEASGYSVTDYATYFYGQCPECQNKKQEER